MAHYSVQSRDRIFLKNYGFLSFAKNMSKNIGENINKNVSGNYTQKPFDHATKSTTNTANSGLKRVTYKTAKAMVTKFPIKSQKSRKIHHRIIQKQLTVKQRIKNLI